MEGLERGRREGGREVFKVMDNQFLSAALLGGTPDSEGEPSCTISALLHFLSLQPPVPEGVCKSIPTFGGEDGGGGELSAIPAFLQPAPPGRSHLGFIYFNCMSLTPASNWEPPVNVLKGTDDVQSQPQ